MYTKWLCHSILLGVVEGQGHRGLERAFHWLCGLNFWPPRVLSFLYNQTLDTTSSAFCLPVCAGSNYIGHHAVIQGYEEGLDSEQRLGDCG